jgi:chromosome partitioning protein
MFTAAALMTDGITFTIPQTWLYGIVGSAAATLLLAALGWSWPHIRAHFGSVMRLRRAEKALEKNGPRIWLAPSIRIEPPADYERQIKKSKPIIVVANLKGGVGKTTTVANLIGHYGLKKNKKILAIDMDFQGSLSAVTLSEADYKDALEQQTDGNPSKVAQLIEGRDPQWVLDTSMAVDGVPTARCVPSYYTLSIMENRIMAEWLIAKRKDDIRFGLARILLHRAIQDRFDIIFIDAPPRLTTGCVQALAAATHVLVPTILDGLSAEASGGFVDQLRINQSIWPHLKLLGVFGNMTNSMTADLNGRPIDGRLLDFEGNALRAAADAVGLVLKSAGPSLRAAEQKPLFPTECFIPDKNELGRQAGHRLAYLPNGGGTAVQELSRAFDRLGDEIDRRISATTRA